MQGEPSCGNGCGSAGDVESAVSDCLVPTAGPPHEHDAGNVGAVRCVRLNLPHITLSLYSLCLIDESSALQLSALV